MRKKIVSAADAIAAIKDGDTLARSGNAGIRLPDEFLAAIEERFEETRGPHI